MSECFHPAAAKLVTSVYSLIGLHYKRYMDRKHHAGFIHPVCTVHAESLIVCVCNNEACAIMCREYLSYLCKTLTHTHTHTCYPLITITPSLHVLYFSLFQQQLCFISSNLYSLTVFLHSSPQVRWRQT